MLIPIRNLGQYGVIYDTPPNKLPGNAWTGSGNIRFYDDSVWKAYGERAIFGNLLGTPQHVYYHRSADTDLWAYMSNEKIYATDGVAHADISNGTYTGTVNDQWEGTHLGGIEIFNNGVDIPQAWLSPALANPVVDLPNWIDQFATCRILRSYKQHLFAFDLTKLSVRFPNLVAWSNPAAPGFPPSSWDPTDPTNDAGEYGLLEKGGQLIDAAVLSNSLMVYKEDQTWAVNYVGGNNIFSFDESAQIGPLTRRHVAEYRNRHYIASAEDIVAFDGLEPQSILDDRTRRWYQTNIDPNEVRNQFMFVNPKENELWVVMPSAGSTYGTLVLIINLKDRTTAVRDLVPTAHVALGPLATTGDAITFNELEGSFNEQQGSFNGNLNSSSSIRMVAAVPGTDQLVLLDDGPTSFGQSSVSFIERTGLAVAGLNRRGEIITDSTTYKQLNEIWPEFRAPIGTVLKVSAGAQEHLNGPIEWEGPLEFIAGVDDKVDCCVAGRYLAIRFETDHNTQWKLDKYDMNIETLGQL